MSLNIQDNLILAHEMSECANPTSKTQEKIKSKIFFVLQGEIFDETFYTEIKKTIESGISKEDIVNKLKSLKEEFGARIADLTFNGEGTNLRVEYAGEFGTDTVKFYNS